MDTADPPKAGFKSAGSGPDSGGADARGSEREAGDAPPETGGRDPEGAEGDGEVPGDDYGRVAGATAAYEKLAAMAREFDTVMQQLEQQLVVKQMRAALDQKAADVRDAYEQQLEMVAQVQSAVQQMQLAVAEMLRIGAGQDPGLGFTAVTQAESARSGTKYARKRWPGRLWDAAWDRLRKIFPLLWAIIGELVTVKEWTVGGQVGGGIFGFASASVSVTFGKP